MSYFGSSRKFIAWGALHLDLFRVIIFTAMRVNVICKGHRKKVDGGGEFI